MITNIFPIVSKIFEQSYSSGAGMGMCSKRSKKDLMAQKQTRFLKISPFSSHGLSKQ